MAAGIGEYIHWHKINYIKYGLYHKNTGKTKEVSQDHARKAFDAAQKEAQARVKAISAKNNTNSREMEKISKFLTGIYFNNKTDNIFKEERERFLKELEAEFNRLRNEKGFTYGGLGKDGYPIIRPILGAKGNRTSRTFTNKEDNKEIDSLLRNLEKGLKNLEKELQITIKSNKQKDLNKLKNNAIKLQKKVSEATKQMQKENPSIQITGSELETLNELYRFVYRPVYSEYGNFGEIAGAVAARMLQDETKKGIAHSIQEVDKILTGSSTTSTIIKGDNFAKKFVDMGSVAKSAELITGTIGNQATYRVKESQQKADITFELSDNPYSSSVKYMGQSSENLKLVSGASVLSLLSDESDQVINHWLNLVTQGVTANGKKETYVERVRGSYAKIKNKSIETIKLIIASKALTGNLYGRSGVASELLVFDAKKQKVYFKNMSTVMNKIIKKKNKLDDIMNLTGNISKYEIGDYSKYYSGVARNRITDLISTVAKEKITLTMLASEIYRD